MSSTKILTKAMNACRNLATKLRAVTGPFAGACTWVAGQLDKLTKCLGTMIEKIEFARKTAVDQDRYIAQLEDAKQIKTFQKLQKVSQYSTGRKITQIVKQSVIKAGKNVKKYGSKQKIVNAGLYKRMAGLQTLIEENVRCDVSTRIKYEDKKGTFKNKSEHEIHRAIDKLKETTLEEYITHVSEAISFGILRHPSDSILPGIDIAPCTNTICNKFLEDLRVQTSANAEVYTHNTKVIDDIVSKISGLISGMIYGRVVAITDKELMSQLSEAQEYPKDSPLLKFI